MFAALTVLPFLSAAALAGGPMKKPSNGPVSSITGKMMSVAVDLGKSQTGKPVQVKEKQVISDLDELIAHWRRSARLARMASRGTTRAAMADSVIRSGTGGIGDLVAPGESKKDWAKLSGRERDRILQSMSEGFPPEYRMVLERYYRRLAEEKAAADTEEKPAKP